MSMIVAAAEGAASLELNLDVPAWEWAAFVTLIVVLLLGDLFVFHRDAREVPVRSAAIESAVWISLGLSFTLVMWGRHGGTAATQYLAGYLIEESLSIDNVFVWAVILTCAPELTRDQRRSLWLHRAIAGRIAEDPQRHIQTARQNLAVMTAAHPRGRAALQLREWETLLAGPVEAVLDVLCSPSPESADLRQNTPFAGALTDPERSTVLAAFRSATRESNRHRR